MNYMELLKNPYAVKEVNFMDYIFHVLYINDIFACFCLFIWFSIPKNITKILPKYYKIFPIYYQKYQKQITKILPKYYKNITKKIKNKDVELK